MPEASDFTSIQTRIRQWHKTHARASTQNPVSPSTPRLFRFRGPARHNAPVGIPFSFTDYLELVDWTGRVLRDDKRGHIPANLPPILERLNIQPEIYLRYMRRQEQGFVHVIGRIDALREVAEALGQKFKKGMGLAGRLFLQPV